MTYRDVVSRQVLTWACTAIGARMPVAMAPLALVFLVRERPGGYSLGAILAAAYVLGEIGGAPVLGMRLRPERARVQLAVGLAVGTMGFLGLGVFPGAHPAVLAGFAFVAGGAPAAATGGLRTLLGELVPARSVAQALSVESILTAGVWAVSPAAVAGLALGVAPRVPLLLAAGLMAWSVGGLWLLPARWGGGDTGGAVGDGPPLLRVLVGAWPVYVVGAASLALLGLSELVLPALLEQRGIGVGWSGPLLTGMAVGGGLGAFVYGLRGWPGLLRTRSLVLMLGTSVCVALAALIPAMAGIAVALVLGGTLQSGAMLTRNLSLREVLPPRALAAGYSVMYAAAGAGYAATGSLAGALLRVAAPSTAILAGVCLTVAMTGVGWWGEARRARRDEGAEGSGEVSGGGAVERGDVGAGVVAEGAKSAK
ncbi:MFS transporter [Streptomyces sp. N50]|uniref:MFS transporter n=1 Tax=Streptomyces sp. N50 TaxID=3081765 RepID=UPI002961FD66|nr:MFS transporter [Streptomyces sp. N50]WOX10415.1 MFS transporter [Streptomyces sp. N50]